MLAGTVQSTMAKPFLKSDQNTDLQSDAVFQLMINDQIQPDIYPVVDFAVQLDVQSWEGQKNIKARFGNPWPGLPGEYKWSDWSANFTYAFPSSPASPKGMLITE